MIDLSGGHIFVAGGGRGIGAATARLAAQAGASVTINYVSNHEAAQTLEKEINAAGGRAWAVQADISEPGKAKAAVDEAVNRLGPLSGLVVSAGVFQGL